jgi:hypothetical protein
MINESNQAPNHLYPNTNPNVELHSGINVYKVRNSQTPNNFWGMKSIRPPPPISGDRNSNPTPKSGVYIASELHFTRYSDSGVLGTPESEYLVKWEGYDDTENSWEPYKNVKKLDKFEEYITSLENKMNRKNRSTK